MSYKLPILFFLVATLNLCPALQLPTSRILINSYVTKSGTVALNKDSNGFYVNVDFSYNINDASDSENYDPSLARVSLALYTSQTVLTYACLGFYHYYCQSYECTQYSMSSTPVFPDFEVSTGYLASTQVYLDYDNWQLHNEATIATSCFSQADSSYGSQRYGLLGLGFNASQTSQNFATYSTTFFVYVAQDASSGTLQFGAECDAVTSKPNAGTLSTTSEWQISTESIVTVQGYYIGSSQNALFDLNANGIGLPIDVFEQLIQYLDQNSGLGCNTGLYMPNCTYNDDINDLPTITITIQGVGIALPPSLYAVDNPNEATTGEQITLKFRALDSTYTGQNYVTSQYTNYIIFDQTFLSYYYAQFAYNNGAPTVTLYNANSSKPIWPYIAGGVAGIVIPLIIVIVCCIKRRKNRKRLAQARGNNSNINGPSQSEEVPLAQGHINIPSAVVNYPSYNHQYPPQFPSQENRAYNYNNNLNYDEQGTNNFAVPVQTEQITSTGEGYVPPVPQVEGGIQAGNQQATYGNDYLQARQAYIRGGM